MPNLPETTPPVQGGHDDDETHEEWTARYDRAMTERLARDRREWERVYYRLAD